MNKLLVVSLATFLAVTAQSAQSEEPIVLSQAELGELFPGKFHAVVNSVVSLDISAKRNGVLVGQMAGDSDQGRWSLKGNKLCVVWSSWMDGKVSCSKVKEADGWYHGIGVKFRKI
jgi:hypothetical protein